MSRTNSILFVAAIAMLVATLVFRFAMDSTPAPSRVQAAAPPSTPSSAPALPTVTVPIKDEKFTLDVAATPATRERGLMYRRSMPKDRGMLFVFEQPNTHAFWMKNTFIDLDLIWLDAAGKVVHIRTLKAHDEVGGGPDTAALYVIELNAGTARRLGLKTGDTIALPPDRLKPATSPTEKP